MKTLIVFYGYGKHTRMIAKQIQSQLNCDLVEIEPVIPYSSDYQSVVDQTENNLQEKTTPVIKDLKVNLNDYQQIILGSPVWWYTIAPPVRTFLNENNLEGKDVHVYATNAGWIGSTFEEIRELCHGNIKSEMNILFTTRHEENKLKTKQEDIDKWIKTIKEDA